MIFAVRENIRLPSSIFPGRTCPKKGSGSKMFQGRPKNGVLTDLFNQKQTVFHPSFRIPTFWNASPPINTTTPPEKRQVWFTNSYLDLIPFRLDSFSVYFSTVNLFSCIWIEISKSNIIPTFRLQTNNKHLRKNGTSWLEKLFFQSLLGSFGYEACLKLKGTPSKNNNPACLVDDVDPCRKYPLSLNFKGTYKLGGIHLDITCLVFFDVSKQNYGSWWFFTNHLKKNNLIVVS